MTDRFLLLVQTLRKAGIPVSLGQVETALEAIKLVGLDQHTLTVTLRAIFAKTRQEMKVFDQVFALCFGSGLPKSGNPVPAGSVEELALKIRAGGCDGKGLGRSGIGASQGNLLVTLLDENAAEGMARSLVTALEWNDREPRPVGAYWEQIKRAVDWHMIHYLVKEKLDLTEWERLFLLERLEQFAVQVEHHLRQELVARQGKAGLEQAAEELNYAKRDFAQLNEAGLQAMEQQVKKLGRRLASRKGFRYRPAPYGKIDLKRTLKGWAARGGVPSKLRRKTRRVEHPELVILCDISNSMSQYTMFFLLLVWTLQARHRKIRSFVFVDRLAEVTHLLKGQQALEGLRFIGMAAPCSATGYTDYGRVFADFVDGYLPVLHGKMKLLVLGDGKNNWRDPQVGAFKAMAERVGAVYWLNPRSPDQWYVKDSVLGLYRPYCKGVYQCSNLAELKQVASLLLKTVTGFFPAPAGEEKRVR